MSDINELVLENYNQNQQGMSTGGKIATGAAVVGGASLIPKAVKKYHANEIGNIAGNMHNSKNLDDMFGSANKIGEHAKSLMQAHKYDIWQ